MKKILLILCFGLLLSSCVNNPSSSQISSVSSNTSSISSSIKESSTSSSTINKEEKVSKSLYGYHPFSEPSINKKLVILIQWEICLMYGIIIEEIMLR